VQANGRMVSDLYLFQVKKPSESKRDWDYYNLLATVPGDTAYPTAANITSTVALFPAQLVTGFTGSGGRGKPDRADDAKAVHHQPHRRWTWRALSPRHTAVDLRPPRAMAGAVRDRAVRLG
jgi:hypothetical protein